MIFTDDYKKNSKSIIDEFNNGNLDIVTAKKKIAKHFKENHEDIVKQQREEILQIAKDKNPKFDLNKNISRYGKSDSEEFFAEAFANSQCGKPNELGNAMNEWLRRKGYDT
jgi:hypothetical protein